MTRRVDLGVLLIMSVAVAIIGCRMRFSNREAGLGRPRPQGARNVFCLDYWMLVIRLSSFEVACATAFSRSGRGD